MDGTLWICIGLFAAFSIVLSIYQHVNSVMVPTGPGVAASILLAAAVYKLRK